MLCIVFWSTLPFEDEACADRAAAKPATKPTDATRLFRFIPSPLDVRERVPQRDGSNASQPSVSDHWPEPHASSSRSQNPGPNGLHDVGDIGLGSCLQSV